MPNPKQQYSSAKTCVKQVPAGMKKIPWTYGAFGSVNLDMGGGKYDLATDYIYEKAGIINMVYDPYNRPEAHNVFVRKFLERYRADYATCFNVLNVIKEKESRIRMMKLMRSLMKPGRVAYFSVYRGEGIKPCKTCNGWQNNKPLKWYLPEVRKVFKTAWIWKGLIIATT